MNINNDNWIINHQLPNCLHSCNGTSTIRVLFPFQIRNTIGSFAEISMYLIWNWKSTSVYICTCILSVDECGTSSIFQNRKLLGDAYQAQHVMRDLKQKYWYCMLLCTYHFKRFIIELNMSQSSQIESMADKPLTMPWSIKNWDND